MSDDITIGVTEIVNNIEVTAQPNDQIIDISVTDNADNVTLNITPTVIEINVNKGSSFAKWGDIYGTLSDQTDLQNALNLKANLVGGKVPASELPSYVDDIVEVANYAALPATGEIGKIYVTLDNNKIYRWSGSVYIEIASNSAIWGAITGTLSSQTDLQTALNGKEATINAGTTAQYWRGDKTFQTLDKTAVGLGNVDNTSDANKPVSTATQTALNLKQNTITLTTTGTTGAATLVGSTLNIPNYTTDISGLVPYTGATTNVDLGTHKLTASDLVINHASGSGVAASITKGGSGEALTVVKSSGSGNAASITGGTTLISELHLTTDLADDYIASAATWNAKQDALTFSSPLLNTSGTISIPVASGSANGYLSSTDWNTFNAKQAALNGTGFVKISGTTISYDSTTYLSGTVAIANGGTGATTASAARTNLGGTTIGSGIFTLPNAGLVSFLRVNADNTVELLGADLFRTSIGAGTGNGSVTSVSGTGSYGGLTLTGTVTGSGDLTLGGTPTGTWPISVSGNAASVNTVFKTTNADHYITFADANNGSPTAEFLYTVGTLKYNPNTGALTAGSFVKSGGTSSQFLKADGSIDSTTYQTALTNPITGTGTTNYLPKFTGASAIGNSLIYDNGTNVGIGTTSPTTKLTVYGGYSNFTDGTINVYAGPDGTGGLFGTVSNHYQRFITNDTERMRITSGGNVGINVSSPADRFQVSGSIAKLTSSGYDGNFDNLIKYGTGPDLNSGNSNANRWIGIDATVTAGSAVANALRIRVYGGGTGNAAPVNVVDFRGDLSTLFYGTVTATGFFNSSDNRLKDLIDYDYNISDIKPITYLWKDGRDNKKHVGYSAQEVQKVMPDAVNEGTDGMLSVNYVEILVAKISQMEKEIAYLKSKI